MWNLRPRKKLKEERSSLRLPKLEFKKKLRSKKEHPRKLEKREEERGGDERNFFSNVKDLLATGFFEGVHVIYVLKKYNVELDGIIEGIGYRCGCPLCNYNQVLSANQFEKHSGFTSSFANNHILLANGVSLNEVVKYLTEVPVSELHKELEAFTGCKIDSKLYEAWRNNMSGHKAKQNLQMKQGAASVYMRQEVPFDSQRTSSFKIGPEFHEDWIKIQVKQIAAGRFPTSRRKVKDNPRVKQSGAIDNTDKEIPSTFVQYSHVVPLEDKEMEAITGCGINSKRCEVQGNGLSPTSAKQTGASDKTILQVLSTSVQSSHELPFKNKEMETIADCENGLSPISVKQTGASDNMNHELPLENKEMETVMGCEINCNLFEDLGNLKQNGASENTSKEVPSTFVQSSYEAPLENKEIETVTGCEISSKLCKDRSNGLGAKLNEMKQTGDNTSHEGLSTFVQSNHEPPLENKKMKTMTGYAIDSTFCEVGGNGLQTGASDNTRQEVPLIVVQTNHVVEMKAVIDCEMNPKLREDWGIGLSPTSDYGVKQNHEAKQSRDIDNTRQEVPLTVVQTNHVLPLTPLFKEMKAVIGCEISPKLHEDRGIVLSPTSDYGVKQNHEAKQIRDIDNTRQEVPLTFAQTVKGVPKKSLFNEMEVPTLFKINSKLCEYRRNDMTSFGASDNMNQEVPSTFVHTNQEVKQTKVGVMTSEKAPPTFTQQLPLNLSSILVQRLTAGGRLLSKAASAEKQQQSQTRPRSDPEGTSPRKKLRFESYSFLPSNVTEVNKLKAGALRTQDIFSPKTPPEFQQKKAISMKRLNVRGVLATGLLEGLPVKYKKDKVELSGFIKDQLYQCGCSSCKYNEVISAVEFERHAGTNSKNQNNHIFLESGISLYALVKYLKDVPHDLICNEIKEKIHSPINMEQFNRGKGSFPTPRKGLQSITVNGENNQPSQAAGLSQEPEQHIVPHSLISNEIKEKIGPQINVEQFDSGKGSFPTQSKGLQSITVNGMNNQPSQAARLSRGPEQPIVPSIDSQILGDNSQAVESSSAQVKGLCNASSCINVESTGPAMEGNVNSTPAGYCNINSTEESDKPGLDILWDNSPTKEKSPAESKSDRKKRSGDLHRTIFDDIQVGAKLVYRSNGEPVLDGSKHEHGILCNHCDRVISPSMFEAHAGFPSRRQPYRNIYTSEGISLHELTSLSNHKILSSVCTICGGEGEMISCGKCRKSFHKVCLGLPCITDASGEWYCSSCKDNLGSGTVSKVLPDASQPANLPFRRVLKQLARAGCALCKGGGFVHESFSPAAAIFCGQCEKQYHVGCWEAARICSLKVRCQPWYNWFCSAECTKIYGCLQHVVQQGPLPISVLKRKTGETDINYEMQWQLLGGRRYRTCENESFFQKATALFKDVYGPILKEDCDILPAMVNGQQAAKEDFVGIYCAILTINSDIVSAGLVRVCGQDVAELPLVATAKEYRGKGYFRVLLTMIEMMLVQWGVKYLINPADEASQSMWINKFEFVKMAKGQVKKYAFDHWTIMFEGTTMLQKSLSQSILNSQRRD